MKKLAFVFVFFLILFNACDTPTPTPQPAAIQKGIFILNEGLWQMNNSTLSFFNTDNKVVIEDLFLQQNNRGLGDTGSDLQKYGNKLYVVVNVSERLEILDLQTGKSLKAISFSGCQPRRICFDQEYAYLSCFNGEIYKIDTVSLSIVDRAQAGANPDGIAVANGKLYVANSGGLNYPNYGNTLSVFDLKNFSLLREISVVTNPVRLIAHNSGKLFLISAGDYSNINSSLQCINTQTDEVIDLQIPASGFAIDEQKLYFYNYNYNTQQSIFQVLDIPTLTIVNENFITDGTSIETPYCIAIDPITHDVYIADVFNYTVTGIVSCFDSFGRKKFDFEVGINPTAIVFRK